MTILFASMSDPLKEFKIMVFIVTVVGALCSLMYIIGVPEARLVKESKFHNEVY